MEKIIIDEIRALADIEYKRFLEKLIPNIEPQSIMGVRVPALRRLAKELVPEREAFLRELPHNYHEENMLHMFFICGIRDFSKCLNEVERFLPFIDNWAVCDSLHPSCFAKNKEPLLEKIKEWLCSSHPYTVRFAIGMLMVYFLKEDFSPEYLDMVASVRSEEYYVKMMVAWYFATALAMRYGETIPYIEGHRLDRWTHNKAIVKARESFRVGENEKAHLKKLSY